MHSSCDQTSKYVARGTLGAHDSIRLPGGLGESRLAENPGAFLTLGDSLSERLRLPIFTVGVGAGLLRCSGISRVSWRLTCLSYVGLALAWSGGVSNLIDRLTRHSLVTDFIFVRVGPMHTGVFNVADTVIMIGIAMLALDFLKRRSSRSIEQPQKERLG